MTNWTDIHPDFTCELQKEWVWYGFSYEETEKWIEEAGLDPEEADFAAYLKSLDYFPDEIGERLDVLRIEYQNEYQEEGIEEQPQLVKAAKSTQKRKAEEEENIDRDWKTINLSFTIELVHSWKKMGFGYQQCQDWINIGMNPADANFCAWLRDIKKVDTEWLLNYGEVEKLQSEYQEHFLIPQQIQVNH